MSEICLHFIPLSDKIMFYFKYFLIVHQMTMSIELLFFYFSYILSEIFNDETWEMFIYIKKERGKFDLSLQNVFTSRFIYGTSHVILANTFQETEVSGWICFCDLRKLIRYFKFPKRQHSDLIFQYHGVHYSLTIQNNQ